MITAALEELAAELNAAGIPATTDPDLVLGMLADGMIAALVGPPTVERVGLGGRVDLDIPVHLACNPPGSLSDWAPVWEALPGALFVCQTREARPVGLSLATATVPAYRLSVARSYVVAN